ncbi:MAG: aspartyl/glutamyl-tRNA amidotransferase subunit B [Candidatus Peregrinibacteria bacterium Gr01-1014_25]|nr:MAG: aspartyl/glutamyl-tRNA amidotransferase subunit B [Candidatus Peregrinibacteria bacterium Gr01-1014_25]
MPLEPVIGLEVHAQIDTRTKLFCGCSTENFGAEPNTTVCPVCMGHPGTLPVCNAVAIEKAIRAALAVGCSVAEHSHFDRKHYFYPDLPSGFQISQYDFPLATHGSVAYDLVDDSGRIAGERICRIHRLHVENDAGKLMHPSTGSGQAGTTLCDFNRAGTPLMEIVTEPDLRSAAEAVAFAQELRRILLAVGASTVDMFKGEMRFDASISLREAGAAKLNPRSEIKNLNSFKALERALQYEERRLRALWEETGGPLKGNITVGWIDDREETKLLREKEDAQDYRYFPEPDIPPLHCPAKMIDDIRHILPVLPRVAREKYRTLGLDEAQTFQLMDDAPLRTIFDAVYAKTGDPRRTSGIVLTQLLGYLKAASKGSAEGPSADAVLALVAAIDGGTISANAGKEVLEAMVQTGKSAADIIAEKGLTQISDVSTIEALVRKAIDANADAVAKFKAGKTAALGAIVGWMMKESKGQADPKLVHEILQRHLSSDIP